MPIWLDCYKLNWRHWSFIICVNSNKNDEFPLQKSWKQILKNLKLWHNWRHISLNILGQCCWKKWIFHFRKIRIQSTYKFCSLFTKRVRTLVFSDIYLTRLVLWKPLFWSLLRSEHLIKIYQNKLYNNETYQKAFGEIQIGARSKTIFETIEQEI